MDGGIVTALRTGAVSGVATDILSRRDAENLGVFGAGVQAKTQIEAILEVRKINCVKIYDINSASAKKLASEMDEINTYTRRFQTVESPDAVVTNSDIVVTATTSKTPVFDGNLLRPGTHINSIGSFKPSSREVDDTTIRRQEKRPAVKMWRKLLPSSPWEWLLSTYPLLRGFTGKQRKTTWESYSKKPQTLENVFVQQKGDRDETR